MEVAATLERDGFNLMALHIGSQSGTHVDSPYHFKNDGPRLEDCDLRSFVGRALIMDCTHLRAREPITWDVFSAYEAECAPPDPSGAPIVVLHTGWSERHWGTDRYFDHPYLEPGACARLLDSGVRTFAIDAVNIDETRFDRNADFPCHQVICGRGGIIAENLTNLSAVDFARPLISLLPIRLGGNADGAPCRAIAIEVLDRE